MYKRWAHGRSGAVDGIQCILTGISMPHLTIHVTELPVASSHKIVNAFAGFFASPTAFKGQRINLDAPFLHSLHTRVSSLRCHSSQIGVRHALRMAHGY